MTITLSKPYLDQIQFGDQITAIDGHSLTRPLIVTSPLTDGRIGLQAPTGSQVEHWLYPDTQVGTVVAVKREGREVTVEPAASKKCQPRPAVSRRYGVTLIATTAPSTGEYKTEDARYVVTKQWTHTWCDDVPHPMRDGSYCPGEQEHVAWGWWVYELDAHGNESECIADFLPTFGDAASVLAQHIAKS